MTHRERAEACKYDIQSRASELEFVDFIEQAIAAAVEEERGKYANVVATAVALNIILCTEDRIRWSSIQDPEYSDVMRLLIPAEGAAEDAMKEAVREYRARSTTTDEKAASGGYRNIPELKIYLFNLSGDYASGVIIVVADADERALELANAYYDGALNHWLSSSYSRPELKSCQISAIKEGMIGEWTYAE